MFGRRLTLAALILLDRQWGASAGADDKNDNNNNNKKTKTKTIAITIIITMTITTCHMSSEAREDCGKPGTNKTMITITKKQGL